MENKELIQFIRDIRYSIDQGYLNPMWHREIKSHRSRLVKIANESDINAYALIEDTCKINGDYWHVEKGEDTGDIAYSEVYGMHIEMADAVHGFFYHGGRCDTYMDSDDAVYCQSDGHFYFDSHLDYFEIVQCYEDDRYYFRDRLHYWESDDNYHMEEEEDEELLDYHSGEGREKKPNKSGFTIGFEIEKSSRIDGMSWSHIMDMSGWAAESDGSVPDGFELVSPTYDLFSQEMFSDIQNLRNYINIPDIENCGGHINFGIVGKDGEQTLKQITGFIPLIYSMYAKRLNGTYCKVKKTNNLDSDKYQSIRIKYDYLEFRIISAVECVDQLNWRIGFFRLMAKHLNASFNQIALKLATKGTDLNEHFTMKGSPYNGAEKFQKMLKRAVRFNQEYNDHIPTSQESINYITKKIAKVCA